MIGAFSVSVAAAVTNVLIGIISITATINNDINFFIFMSLPLFFSKKFHYVFLPEKSGIDLFYYL